MRIKLEPQRRGDTLVIVKSGKVLTVNGEVFDLTRMADGDTLPRQAFASEWFVGDVTQTNGELSLAILFPNPWNYSQEQAFPVDLVGVPDGRVVFPPPLPDVEGGYPELPPLPVDITVGAIDWSKLITQAGKATAADAEHLALMKADLAVRNAQAAAQITKIQDQIDTIGYGIDIGKATAEEAAEQAALLISLAAWKAYKFDLSKVVKQPGWHESPVWPDMPVSISDPDAQQAA